MQEKLPWAGGASRRQPTVRHSGEGCTSERHSPGTGEFISGLLLAATEPLMFVIAVFFLNIDCMVWMGMGRPSPSIVHCDFFMGDSPALLGHFPVGQWRWTFIEWCCLNELMILQNSWFDLNSLRKLGQWIREIKKIVWGVLPVAL